MKINFWQRQDILDEVFYHIKGFIKDLSLDEKDKTICGTLTIIIKISVKKERR